MCLKKFLSNSSQWFFAILDANGDQFHQLKRLLILQVGFYYQDIYQINDLLNRQESTVKNQQENSKNNREIDKEIDNSPRPDF